MSNSASGEIFGHPKGLFLLFFVEMWERFSFYGMRALLTLYMVKSLMYEHSEAMGTYGAYTGLVYATPLFGGMLADRFLGYRKAIMIGGVLMALGHFAMAIEQPLFFYGALGLLIAGNGLFKPNISTLVGTLYPEGDPRRDGAFTIFYMGINLGAFLAPLICGFIGETYGWHYGFGLAGIGMVLGLLLFMKWQSLVGEHGLPPKPQLFSERSVVGVSNLNALYIAIAIAVPFFGLLVSRPTWVQWSLPFLGGGALIYILREAFKCTREERDRIFVIIVLVFFSITFWACFEQAGSSLTLFTKDHVDRNFFGWEIPASMFQSINPMFILILAIPFSLLWSKLGRVNRDPSSPMKFALALFQIGLGFVALIIAAQQAADGNKAAMGWIILAYFLHTTGELCLSPIGLSMVTKMAPKHLAALLMGVWFLSNAFANVIAGRIAAFTGGDAGYEGVFTIIVYVSVGAGIVLVLITPILKRLRHGVT